MISLQVFSDIRKRLAKLESKILSNPAAVTVLSQAQLQALTTEAIDLLPGNTTHTLAPAIAYPSGYTKARVITRITALMTVNGCTSPRGTVELDPSTTVPHSKQISRCTQPGAGVGDYTNATCFAISYDATSAIANPVITVALNKIDAFTSVTFLKVNLTYDTDILYYN